MSTVSTGRLDHVARARAQMFAVFVEELNRAAIPYCLLSGYADYSGIGGSDLDFIVGSTDAGRMPQLLQEVARRSGALLVQAMQHETTAWYFVLAKRTGDKGAYLHPDCASDYRREGRLWLRSEDLLSRRRRSGSFFVPAGPDEFLYYLIKKVLKGEIDVAQLNRLRGLYVSSANECCAGMRRFWLTENVSTIVSAMLSSNVRRMRWILPSLRAELLASRQVEGFSSRIVQHAREVQRRARRVMHPAGVNVVVCGGNGRRQDEFVAGLERNLRPAFRRTRVLEGATAGPAIWQWMAKVQSTLVIRKMASRSSIASVRSRLGFDLSEAAPDVELATRMVLDQMAARITRRLQTSGASDSASAHITN